MDHNKSMITFRDSTYENIADIVCGNKDGKFSKNFPYRSSSYLTKFFRDCDLEYTHDGSTRKYWVANVLKEIASLTASSDNLPSDHMVAVLTQVMDVDYFDRTDCDRAKAFLDLNSLLERYGLQVYEDSTFKCHLRNTGTGESVAMNQIRPRPLSIAEKEQRERILKYLKHASEDDFTEIILVPFFQRLGFHRVVAEGHKEKLLEYGKGLWMKFQLPTSHWIYFSAQIKRVKIDSKGSSNGNVAEVLNQAKMALAHPIFDPDLNKKVLLDHLYIISAAEITRQAKAWLVQNLDQESRRHIIFMDREDFLHHAARIICDIPIGFDSVV